MTGSPRALTPPTSRRSRRYWTSSGDKIGVPNTPLQQNAQDCHTGVTPTSQRTSPPVLRRVTELVAEFSLSAYTTDTQLSRVKRLPLIWNHSTACREAESERLIPRRGIIGTTHGLPAFPHGLCTGSVRLAGCTDRLGQQRGSGPSLAGKRDTARRWDQVPVAGPLRHHALEN